MKSPVVSFTVDISLWVVNLDPRRCLPPSLFLIPFIYFLYKRSTFQIVEFFCCYRFFNPSLPLAGEVCSDGQRELLAQSNRGT